MENNDVKWGIINLFIVQRERKRGVCRDVIIEILMTIKTL